MDTRTRTASPAGAQEDAQHPTPPPVQDKISAYYSLVFPHYTFYIQTLSITIGRRCAPNAANSSNPDASQVDVDLGALKSVSRLHAKIEYDQEEDRFVLIVIGRNGAWVDGVWSGAGTRSPLGERSQIQIASRTFHFVLPPPPPPEDTPSPSSQSSVHRQRSPSVDITSISPPSSQPSHSPPPLEVKLPPLSPEPQSEVPVPSPPKLKPKTHLQPQLPPQPELPNSNSIGKSNKTNSKKRKKSDVDPPPVIERPKPEDMPPKPPFTYAQLIYRAIKEIGGKATLQEICSWIMNTHEHYRYADGAWMSSVRHNLSSNRAFLKMDRCGGDRGKGYFWSVDDKFSQTLEEQELKVKQAAAAAAQGLPPGSSEMQSKARKKEKGAMLEPPLKRSVKGDLKGVPLPPPLTSSPLPFKNTLSPTPVPLAPPAPTSSTSDVQSPKSINVGAPTTSATGVFTYSSLAPNAQPRTGIPQQSSVLTAAGYTRPATNPYAPLAQPNWGLHSTPANAVASTSATSPTSLPPSTTPAVFVSPQASATVTAVVPDVVIPIILGPIPLTHPDYAPNHPNNSAKEGYMILHERKLILDPDIFAELTKEMLEELEKMGAREALGVLTNHMIRALKERRAKGRGKDKKRTKGAGRGTSKKAAGVTTAPFTNVPLENRKKSVDVAAAAAPTDATMAVKPEPDSSSTELTTAPAPSSTDPTAQPMSAKVPSMDEDPGSPLIVVDDDSEDDEPAAKRRKVDSGLGVAS
ncbi:hypothetical protein BDN70DRAFT_883078 [Pholiota conissans]|uniref:Uncharacterized protein n=1 Tax=Pholiota conissans TaxID=109636 RepID=A0A9P5YXS4_9AGAR|nr:hypothetical protein BDN70DRAFT_883078 [Pholiota conissans]